jgi:hypothetical protein
MSTLTASIVFENLCFYDAPDDIEGSPFWVDLWASVNGYRIGLQIKPQTYKAASLSIYTGKARSSQNKGHKLFKQKFGGRVFIAMPSKGILDPETQSQLIEEMAMLKRLPPGDFPELP